LVKALAYTNHEETNWLSQCLSCRRCATLPLDWEASHYGPRLSGLVGLLGSAIPLSVGKPQALLDQLLGIEIRFRP